MEPANRYQLMIILICALLGGVWYLSESNFVANVISVLRGTEKAVYHCPTHTVFKSDFPGRCKFCGVRLIKLQPKEFPEPIKSVDMGPTNVVREAVRAEPKTNMTTDTSQSQPAESVEVSHAAQ